MRTVLLLSILLAAPLAVADAFTYEGEIVATAAAVVVGEGHDFEFAAQMGDLIEVGLAWAESPLRDLDLLLAVPTGGCPLLPDPDAPCILGEVTTVAPCPGRGTLTSEESLTLVAPADGTYRLGVVSNLPGRTAYALTLAVDDAAPDVDGPLPTRHVQADSACRLA